MVKLCQLIVHKLSEFGGCRQKKQTINGKFTSTATILMDNSQGLNQYSQFPQV